MLLLIAWLLCRSLEAQSRLVIGTSGGWNTLHSAGGEWSSHSPPPKKKPGAQTAKNTKPPPAPSSQLSAGCL